MCRHIKTAFLIYVCLKTFQNCNNFREQLELKWCLKGFQDDNFIRAAALTILGVKLLKKLLIQKLKC